MDAQSRKRLSKRFQVKGRVFSSVGSEIISGTTLRLMFSIVLVTAPLASCSTFQGPGPFVGPGGVIEAGTENGARLVMRGERQVFRAESTVRFDWPVDRAKMSRGFFYSGRSHWGVDLANTRGTPILASERGVVIYTGRSFRGYGNLIVIEHNEEWATLYSHLDRILVEEGAAVERGQKIGTMGRTGRATGVHLHFEIRHNRQPVNPLAYLPPGF